MNQMRLQNERQMLRWRHIQDIRAQGSWPCLRSLKEGLVQFGWAISDNLRTSLVMAVFTFKVNTHN